MCTKEILKYYGIVVPVKYGATSGKFKFKELPTLHGKYHQWLYTKKSLFLLLRFHRYL